MSSDAREEWNEWGEEPPESSSMTINDETQSIYEPVASKNVAIQQETKPGKPPRVPLAWSWDLDELESDLKALPASTEDAIIATLQPVDDNDMVAHLASLVLPARARLDAFKGEMELLKGQALVTKWNLLRLQQSLESHDGGAIDTSEDAESLTALEEELQSLAGDWRVEQETDDATVQQLQEMSALLQSSLVACDSDDISPFQQALEQLFGSQSSGSLCVPMSWIRPVDKPPTTSHPSPFDTFLQRLVQLCDDNTRDRVAVLTEAQRFQDAKDIQRDEVVVNGDLLTGSTLGYEAIIAAIESHIRHAMATAGGFTSLNTTDADASHNVAKHLLNACNRTESGGGSYEILSQFISNHSMDVVLIRPASAKAPPLQILMDVGPFQTQDMAWSFGVRVHVSAVTWYCICDASDPTVEFYEVQTTYTNRLAFPLGLAPLAIATSMCRDTATVTITLLSSDDADPDCQSVEPGYDHHYHQERHEEEDEEEEENLDAML